MGPCCRRAASTPQGGTARQNATESFDFAAGGPFLTSAHPGSCCHRPASTPQGSGGHHTMGGKGGGGAAPDRKLGSLRALRSRLRFRTSPLAPGGCLCFCVSVEFLSVGPLWGPLWRTFLLTLWAWRTGRWKSLNLYVFFILNLLLSIPPLLPGVPWRTLILALGASGGEEPGQKGRY